MALATLIDEYAEAVVADSWKGGGDPESYGEIELRLKLAKIKMNLHAAAVDGFHAAVLVVASKLIARDPLLETESGKILSELADAIQDYEKVMYAIHP